MDFFLFLRIAPYAETIQPFNGHILLCWILEGFVSGRMDCVWEGLGILGDCALGRDVYWLGDCGLWANALKDIGAIMHLYQ